MNRHQRRQAKAQKLSDEEMAELAAIPVVMTAAKKAKLGWSRPRAKRLGALNRYLASKKPRFWRD
jgi:cytochrome c553